MCSSSSANKVTDETGLGKLKVLEQWYQFIDLNWATSQLHQNFLGRIFENRNIWVSYAQRC
jgi:hypothetical protein